MPSRVSLLLAAAVFHLQLLLIELGFGFAARRAGLGASGHHDYKVSVLIGASKVTSSVRGQGFLWDEGELREDGGVPLNNVFLFLLEMFVDDLCIHTSACRSAFWKL